MGLLTADERVQLRNEVARYILGNPYRLTRVIPYQHVIRIKPDPIPEEYAHCIIRYCEMSAWVEDPALIIQLLTEFRHLRVFQDAIDRIRQGRPPSFHRSPIWDTILLALDLPFIDRELTRKAIESFSYSLDSSARPGVRVLIVKGPRFSGKSFTYEYIRYVYSFQDSTTVFNVWVDFKKQATSRFGALDLTRALLDQINPDWHVQIELPVLNAEQPARWIIQLCTVIVEQIAKINKRCIIVLDGLDDNRVAGSQDESQRVPQESIDMITRLSAIACGSELAEESNDLMRLVLLGFNYPITNYKERVREEDIKPITANAIRKYFIKYAEFYERVIDDQGLSDMVTAVLNGDQADDPHRTERLAKRSLAVARAIINS
jgi:hypothetical protein